jgi:hypothetical protein
VTYIKPRSTKYCTSTEVESTAFAGQLTKLKRKRRRSLGCFLGEAEEIIKEEVGRGEERARHRKYLETGSSQLLKSNISVNLAESTTATVKAVSHNIRQPSLFFSVLSAC